MKPIISVSFEVGESEKKLPSFLYGGIIQATLLLLSMVGALRIFLIAFDIPMAYKEIRIYIIAFMVLFYLLFSFRKATKYTLPICIAVYFLIVKINFQQVKEGCFNILNLYIGAYNKYENVNLMSFNTTHIPEGETIVTFLLAILFLIIGIISFVIFRNKMLILYFIATLPLIIAVLSVGLVPNYFYFVMYIVGGAGVTASVCVKKQKRAGKGKAVFQSAAAMMVLLCVAWLISLIIIPEGAYNKEIKVINAAKKNWQETMLSWDITDMAANMMFKTSAAGGIGEGNLGRFSEVKFKNKVIFEVTLPETLNNLYLRSYVGATYTGHGWDPLGEEGLGADKQVLETLNEQGFSSVNQSILFFDASKDFTFDEYEKVELTVKDVEEGEKYKKIPYYGETQGGADGVQQETTPFLNQLKPELENKYYGYYFDQNEDLKQRYYKIVGTYINAAAVKRNLDYLVVNTMEINNGENEIKIGGIDKGDGSKRRYLEMVCQQFDEYAEKEKQYRDLVYNQYLGLPENSCQELIKEWGDKLQYSGAPKVDSVNYLQDYPTGLTNLHDISGYVKEYLSENTVYSLNPGNTPKDKDFLEYFLTENKKGYCSYYATAATIMFRSMGVPARYVEGYVVTKADIMSGTNHGKGMVTAKIKDTNAHAWTEIYMDGFGWVSVDATPGYLKEGVTSLPQDITNPVPVGNGKPPDANIPEIPVQSEQGKLPLPKEPIKENEEVVKPEIGTEVVDREYIENGNHTVFLRWAKYIAIVLFICILVLTLICSVIYVYWRMSTIKKERILMDGTAPNQARVYYRDINSMLRCIGKKVEDTTGSAKYCGQMESIFPSIEKSTIMDCIKVMEKVSYSNQVISEADVEKVKDCYQEILKTMYFRTTKIQRAKLKYFNMVYPILWNNDSGTRNTI